MSVTFSINGTSYTCSSSDPFFSPTTSLSDFIRARTNHIVRVFDNCGICGCCTVSATWKEAGAGGKVITRAINSCLANIWSLDGYAFTTIDGTGNSVDGYSKIQKAFAANAQSMQCSYCSVGFEMLLECALKENPNLTGAELQSLLDGNYCRCTGTLGLQNTIASFGSDKQKVWEGIEKKACVKANCCQNKMKGRQVDVEDALVVVPPAASATSAASSQQQEEQHQCEDEEEPIPWQKIAVEEVLKYDRIKNNNNNTKKPHTFNQTSKKAEQEQKTPSVTAAASSSSPLPPPPSYEIAKKIKQQQQQEGDEEDSFKKSVIADEKVFVQCATLSELSAAWKQFASNKKMILASGTSFGIYKNQNDFDVFLHLDKISDMSGASLTATNAVIGGSSTIKDAIAFFTANEKRTGCSHFDQLRAHFLRIAGDAIRGRATLGGNLGVCKRHSTAGDSFPSDAAIALVGVNASVKLFDPNLGFTRTMSLIDFFSTATSANLVILQVLIPLVPQGQNFVFQSYKIALRSQMDHATVNAGMSASLVGGKIATKPTIAIGGCFPAPTRVASVESMLVGADPTNLATVQKVCQQLATEVKAGIDPSSGNVAFRINTAANFLYKFMLALNPSLPADLQNAKQTWFSFEEQKSTHTYCPPDPSYSPVGIPMAKSDALTLAAGEAHFCADERPRVGMLFAAQVMSNDAGCTITAIDKNAASQVAGFVKYVDKSTVAKIGGSNKFMQGPPILFAGDVGDAVNYNGQLIGLAVADTLQHARLAASLIEKSITYSAKKSKLVLTVDEAIANKTYLPDGIPVSPVTAKVGDVTTAMAAAKTKCSGSFHLGSQYHMPTENNTTIVEPFGEELNVECNSQGVAAVQQQLAMTLQMPASNARVTTRRCGGGFGARGTAAMFTTAAASVAARALRRTIKLEQTQEDMPRGLGTRPQYRCDFTAGLDANNKITALEAKLYLCCGWTMTDDAFESMTAVLNFDSATFIPNCLVEGYFLRANRSPATSCRAPGWGQSMFLNNMILSAIAAQVKIPRVTLQGNNLLMKGDATFSGLTIETPQLSECWNKLLSTYNAKRLTVDAFNKTSKFVKRGVTISAMRFPVTWLGVQQYAQLQICADGSVAVTVSGIEIGQGLNQKCMQAACYALKLKEDDLPTFRVLPPNSSMNSTNGGTGGSITSELCCKAVVSAGDELCKRLEPFQKEGLKWADVIALALSAGTDLVARATSGPLATHKFRYNTYGVAVTEMEIDSLSGQYKALSTSIEFDCGISLNPALDVAQVQGAMMFGVGWALTETTPYSPENGAALNASTWSYKPPYAHDAPRDFNVTLLPNAQNAQGVMMSRAQGEPPIGLAISFVHAIEDAINAVRKETMTSQYTPFVVDHLPFTVYDIANACNVSPSSYSM